MRYIHRVLESTITDYLQTFSVVGITGPRQSGKSTMLRQMLGEQFEYITFDDLDNISRFDEDPKRFMKQYGDNIIFDEVQRVPDLFSFIKLAVDNDRQKKGKFILTGSSQFAFMKNVSESLAGRIGLLSLLPFQFSEVPESLRQHSLYQGGYPELVTSHYRSSSNWYSSYLDTYLTRDLRDIKDIGNIHDFRKCLQMLAARTSRLLNLSEISRDIGVSIPTIKKWISALEASYILFLLPPYYNNLGKRIIKSPKIYFFDTGLVSYLTGIKNKELFEQGPMYGALFENYIVSEFYKNSLHRRLDRELYFYRTSNGTEIDLIVDEKTSKSFYEIKASETFRSEMTAALKQHKPENSQGYLLYRGKSLDTQTDLRIMNFEEYFSTC